MKAWSFDNILAPIKADDFLGQALGRRHLLVSGEPDKFSALLSWSDLNTILSSTGLDLTRIRVSHQGGDVPAQHFSRSGLSGFSFLSVAELNSLLSDGAVLTIDAPEDMHQPISDFCRAIERSIGLPVQAQIRCGFRRSADSVMLSHDHDVMVFGLIGRSGWQVESNSGADATSQDCSTPSLLAMLNPGDLLYVPRGRRHAEQSFDEPLVFLTVIFKNPSGIEIVGRLFDRLKETDIAKVEVPRFGGDDIQAQYLTELQAEILRICTEPGLLLGFMKDLWSISEPRRSLSLPWSAVPDLSLLPRDMEFHAAVRFPHQDSLVYLREGENFEIIHDYKKICVNRAGAGILERLFKHGALSVCAILESCSLPEEQTLAILSELIKAGVIIAREPLVDQHPKQPDLSASL